MAEPAAGSSTHLATGLTNPTKAIVVTRPLGDQGGIQEYSRRALQSSAIEAIAVGSARRSHRRRWVRALRRGASVFHFYAAAIRHPHTPVVVGHLRLIETLPAVFSNRRMVVVVYGREVEDLHPWVQALWQRAERWGRIQFAAISNATADLAGEHGWETRAWSFLPPALWSDRPIQMPRARDDGPLEVISVSRLDSNSRRKNIDILISAIAHVHAERLPIHLVIVGDGDLSDEMAQLATRIAPDLVTFAGHVSDDERTRLLSGAHVLALPSEQEGFGLVVLEAWEAGLAVVGCNRRALAEVVEDGVTGFSPEPDASSVARALMKLYDDDLRIRMAANGVEALRSSYSPSVFDENLRSLLRRPA